MKCLFPLMLAFIIMLLMFNACKTDPKVASLSGNVMLINDSGDMTYDPVDHSGVVVSLYELAELDTTLARINLEHPQAGVQISQETEFDHRQHQPLKSTVSDPAGDFKFDNIDPGTYNLVIYKELWGIRYVYRINVGESMDTDIGTIELYPAELYVSTDFEDLTFRSDHTYLLDGNVNFIGAVTLEPRAMVYASPGSIIKFYGNLHTPADSDIVNAWRIMSSEDIYTNMQSPVDQGNNISSLEIHGDNVELRHGIIHHIGNSIKLTCDQSQIGHMIIRYTNSGFIMSNCAAEISNTTFAHSIGIDTGVALSIQSATNIPSITSSVFLEQNWGIMVGSVSVTNCYFMGNHSSMRIAGTTSSVTHCEFIDNHIDIALYSVIDPVNISYNNFFSTGMQSIIPWFDADIHNNNFHSTAGNFISIWTPDLAGNAYVNDDLDATNNYWGVSNIDAYLIDATDNSSHPNEPCEYYVVYLPKRYTPIASAGIQ